MSDPIKHVSDWLKPSEEPETDEQETTQKTTQEEKGYSPKVFGTSSVDLTLESLDDYVSAIGDVDLTVVDIDLTGPDQDEVDFDIDLNEDNTLSSDPDVSPIHFEFDFTPFLNTTPQGGDIDLTEDDASSFDYEDYSPAHFELGVMGENEQAIGKPGPNPRGCELAQRAGDSAAYIAKLESHINKLERRLCQIESEQRSIEAKLRELGE